MWEESEMNVCQLKLLLFALPSLHSIMSVAPVVTEKPINGKNAQQYGTVSLPSGLQPLTHMDYIRIRQKIEKCECCTGCETENRYKLYNVQGQPMFKAKEHSSCCCRQCCGNNRPFQMSIKNLNGQEIIQFERPCRCQLGCFPCCCLQKMEVFFSNGRKAGVVEQVFTCFRPQFRILDENDEEVLQIEGPCRTCTCCVFCRSVGFNVKQDDQPIGMIRKEFSGEGKEALTDADNFYVTFPAHLDVKLKATLIGAVFLLDFMYFES